MAITRLIHNSLPSGSILQVHQASSSTNVENSSNAYVDLTGVSQAITPSSTSNKVLIHFSIQFNINTASINNDDSWGGFRLLRDSTTIFNPISDSSGNRPFEIGMSQQGVNSSRQLRNRFNFTFLDSPSSTSSLTYKVQSRNYQTHSIKVNEASNQNGTSFIQVMEVKG